MTETILAIVVLTISAAPILLGFFLLAAASIGPWVPRK